VPRDHAGRGVVCGECRRLLRLPGPDEEVPEPVAAAAAAEPEAKKRAARPRPRGRRRGEALEERFGTEHGGGGMLGPVLWLSLITVLVAVGASLLGRGQEGTGIGEESPYAGSVELASEDEQPDEVELEAATPIATAVIREELLPVIREFLEAPTPERRAELSLRPQRTLERMRSFGLEHEAVGFRSVVWSVSSERRGPWARLVVEHGDFERWPIALARDAEGEWRVHWESWAGWSEVDWSRLDEALPSGPQLCRVKVSGVEYYNFEFADEERFSSFLLETSLPEVAVYGYVPRDGALDHRLSSIDGVTRRPFTLMLEFPEAGRSGRQARITEIVCEGWLDLESSP